jgi:alpha-L-fucosidase
MKTAKFGAIPISLLLMSLLLSCAARTSDTSGEQAHYEPNWKSLSRWEVPQWFEDAVLGIYFHWGVYSVPEFGCWGGRNMYQPNGGDSEDWGHIEDKYKNTYEYVKHVYGEPGTEFGYKDFIPLFKAEKWDPNSWAELFKEAGADFAGPVAIHHDGFAMWDSEYAEFNSMDMGPHRDVVGEILQAVREQGMMTFASFHQYTNWFFFNPGRKLCPEGVDVNDPEYAGIYGPVREYRGDWREYAFSESFQEAWYNKVIEVIDNYQPEQLWFEIGFTDPGCIGKDYAKLVLAHYYNSAEQWGKAVVVTRKDDDLPLSCSVLDIEAGELEEAQEDVWQTDTPLGTNWAWAYSPDAVCMPVNAIVDGIVDRKSKNGITLLSVAPMADGTLPPSQFDGLKELGKWMAINKEALYATRPAPFVKGGADNWKAGTIRFTEKGQFLFAIELGNEWEETDGSPDYEDSQPPSAPYMIPGVAPMKDSIITILGYSEALPWHQEGKSVVIEELPEPLPCDHAWSFKIQVR